MVLIHNKGFDSTLSVTQALKLCSAGSQQILATLQPVHISDVEYIGTTTRIQEVQLGGITACIIFVKWIRPAKQKVANQQSFEQLVSVEDANPQNIARA